MWLGLQRERETAKEGRGDWFREGCWGRLHRRGDVFALDPEGWVEICWGDLRGENRHFRWGYLPEPGWGGKESHVWGHKKLQAGEVGRPPTWRALKVLKFEFYSWEPGAIEGLGSPVFQMMKFKFNWMKLSSLKKCLVRSSARFSIGLFEWSSLVSLEGQRFSTHFLKMNLEPFWKSFYYYYLMGEGWKKIIHECLKCKISNSLKALWDGIENSTVCIAPAEIRGHGGGYVSVSVSCSLS